MKNKLVININKFKYDENAQDLISNLHVDLSDGDILWLSGPVGCGKTTLLKIIGGIIPAIENGSLDGEVLLNEQTVKEKVLANVTFCFQHSDNQLLFDTVHRQFFGEKEEVEGFLKEVDILDIASKSVMDLSRGQRKFVTLMCTLRKKRNIYIFDEPLDLLDSGRKKMVLEKIREKSKEAIVLISSHDNQIEKIASKKLSCNRLGIWEIDNYTDEKSFEDLYLIPTKKVKKIIIKAKDLSYRFEGNNCDLNFPDIKIFQNEIMGIVGVNGSGKTTLIKMLFDKSFSSRSNIVQREFSRAGFMFQNVNRQLFGNTVFEELFVGGGGEDKTRVTYAEDLLDELGLLSFKDSHPIFLSGGQKQKLVFASLLFHQPDILFLDEVFTNLDTDSVNTILKLISNYRQKRDLTVVLTDQGTEYLEKICERIIEI